MNTLHGGRACCDSHERKATCSGFPGARWFLELLVLLLLVSIPLLLRLTDDPRGCAVLTVVASCISLHLFSMAQVHVAEREVAVFREGNTAPTKVSLDKWFLWLYDVPKCVVLDAPSGSGHL